MLEEGFEIVDHFISLATREAILRDLQGLEPGARGIRNIDKKSAAVAELCGNPDLLDRASSYLSGKASLVRAIVFTKSSENNWLVSWHQDKTVAVTDRFDRKDWGPWSIKDNTLHVQAPIDVLNQMVTIRIHLDDISEANGGLKVLPNSHRLGLLDQASIKHYTDKTQAHTCIAKKCSALIMRPHLLHCSSKAKAPSQRRILHLEYSSYPLPAGITWASH